MKCLKIRPLFLKNRKVFFIMKKRSVDERHDEPAIRDESRG